MTPAFEVHGGSAGSIAAYAAMGAGEASVVGFSGKVGFCFHEIGLHFRHYNAVIPQYKRVRTLLYYG